MEQPDEYEDSARASRESSEGLAAIDDSLMSVGTEATSPQHATNLLWIDVDRLRPNRFQPRKRFAEGELEELAASIQSTGILQPIIIRRLGEGYELVAGERRWRAAQRAGLLRIPALVREIPDDRLLETALIENIQRQELNPIEEGRAYATLMETLGLTQSEVAERVGRERSSIANYLRLLALSPSVQTLVEEGKLSMGHARALAGLPSHRAQNLAAEITTKRGLSVRQTETWVRHHTEEPKAPNSKPRIDPNVVAAEEGLQRRLGTKVRIIASRGEKGRILIEYYSAAELDRLYEHLTRP
jgi:ParB family chromosome partitioning protein